MLSELLEKVSLFRILHRIDTDLCKQLRQKEKEGRPLYIYI